MQRAALKAVASFFSLVAFVALATTAHADPLKCQRGILKESQKFAQAKMKSLKKCEENVLKGKIPSCPDMKTTDAIAKAAVKLSAGINKSCGGADKICGTPGDDSLASISWPGVCPDFENQGCTNVISDCNGIVTCLQCINEAAIDQAISLYYDSANPSGPGSQLNKCQIAIGKAAAAFFASKTKAIGKCWDARHNGKHTGSCVPPAAGDGKYLAAIDKAETKKIDTINKACTGLAIAAIGFPSHCPAVTIPGGIPCGGPVTNLPQLIQCVDCVTEFKVDCEVPAAVPTFVPYPAECPGEVQTPTPTATKTPTPTITATPTATATKTVTPTPTLTATKTPTPTLTATKTSTPVLTVTPTATPTATPTPTVTATPVLCGNGVLDAGEDCDLSAGVNCAAGSNTSAAFACSVSCTCACPTKVKFAGDNTDPATILDTGWTGIAHRAPVISNGDVTIAVSGCAGSSRPCGICNVSGPIANTGNELRNQRCSGDTSVQCTNAPNGAGGPCTGLGLCQFYFGAPLPLVAGGVGTCVSNQFNGSVNGTANIETGAAVTNAFLTSRVHSAVISTDTPCPVCVGDPTPNDGVLGGTCTGGPRNGLTCDGNGTVFNRPDFGTTSLDCPPPASTIAVLPIDLSNSTGTVSKTITFGSPNCSAGGLPAGMKCACDTCNNATAEPCDTNGDCPISGGNPGICGGRRCIGGTNVGAPCTVASQCPGAGSCARPGEPTKPNGCVDNTTTPLINGSLCVDTAPMGDHEGECIEGPPTGICSLASGHQQRSCTDEDDCCDDAPACVTDPPTPGDCEISNRLCFLDNGRPATCVGGTNNGAPCIVASECPGGGTCTGTSSASIVGIGMADPPTNDVSDPTLAAVFCIGPTSAPAVNIAAGLPGPGRTTLKGTATGIP